MNITAVAKPIRTRPWAAYLVAFAMTLVGVGATELFTDSLRPFPLLMATMAVTVVAFLGGRGRRS